MASGGRSRLNDKLGTASSTLEQLFQMNPKPEILIKIAQATTALTKLKPIWRDNNISLGWIKGKTDALSCHIHTFVRLCVMDLDGRAKEKDAGL